MSETAKISSDVASMKYFHVLAIFELGTRIIGGPPPSSEEEGKAEQWCEDDKQCLAVILPRSIELVILNTLDVNDIEVLFRLLQNFGVGKETHLSQLERVIVQSRDHSVTSTLEDSGKWFVRTQAPHPDFWAANPGVMRIDMRRIEEGRLMGDELRGERLRWLSRK